MTVAVTGLLLFGGWYLYNSFALEQPLARAIAQVDGVASSHPVIGRDQVTVNLELKKDADIREVYGNVSRKGAAVVGSRELKINIDQNASPELEKLWSSVLFPVAEAMETRTYSKIPAALAELEKANNGLAAQTNMDDTNVYITLRKGDDVKHVVLPRTPDKMGVWPNA